MLEKSKTYIPKVLQAGRDKAMNGTVKTIVSERQFGFIRADINNIEYFFHKDDFEGHWNDLVADFGKMTIPVSFDEKASSRGPRASSVKRLDFPNEG
jgi:cold shock CspA family protein